MIEYSARRGLTQARSASEGPSLRWRFGLVCSVPRWRCGLVSKLPARSITLPRRSPARRPRTPRTCGAPGKAALRPLLSALHWGVFLLLAGWLVFCHGCHGDDDSELCVPGWKAPQTDEGRQEAPGSAAVSAADDAGGAPALPG